MSILQKLDTVLTGTLPRLQIDPVVPPLGGVFLFDFASVATIAAGSTIAVGSVVNNLVAGGRGGVFTGGASYGAGAPTLAGGGVDFGAATNARIDLGVYAFDTTHDYLFIAWALARNTGKFYSSIIGNAGATGGYSVDNSWWITAGPAGDGYAADVWSGPDDGTNRKTSGVEGGATSGLTGVQQFAFSAQYGSTKAVKIFRNGVLKSSAAITYAGADRMHSSTKTVAIAGVSGGVAGSSQYTGRVYCVYAEDLTLSRRDPLTVVQQDYAARTGKYS